ncbi:hypothetical protein GCM10010415_66050 [Streptomyces atrovirens]
MRDHLDSKIIPGRPANVTTPPQGLRSRRSDRHVRPLVPDEPVSDFGKETHRQQEVATDTGRQITQSTLETAAAGKAGRGAFDGPTVQAEPLERLDALAGMRYRTPRWDSHCRKWRWS